MSEVFWNPGRFTVARVGRDVVKHLPAVLRSAPQLRGGFANLPKGAQPATMLRQAKLLGCPVCRAIFPRIAKRAGLSEAQVQAAVDGDLPRLPPDIGAAIAWVEALIIGDGAKPEVIPDAAQALSDEQRSFLAAWTRIDLLVHSLGLFFLPHLLVERARA